MIQDQKKKTELIKVLGVNQKAGVKVGDEIKHPLQGFKTKVVAVYKDFLGNERVLTEHNKKTCGGEGKGRGQRMEEEGS